MLNLLIVEDSDADLNLYQKMFNESNQIHLFYAQSGEEAVTIIKQTHIDMFCLDVQLPGMDGFAVARAIRETPGYMLTPIVFITGYSRNQLEAFRTFHCYDYIIKPFTLEELHTKLFSLIERLGAHKAEEKQQLPKRKMTLFLTDSGEYLIDAQKIDYAESERNNTILHTEEKTFRLVGVSLKEAIETVNSPYFLRCHKSFAVNVSKIYGFRDVNYRLWHILLHNRNDHVDLSKKYYQDIMDCIKALEDQPKKP